MTAGPDGSVWFTEGQKIARITPAGALTEFPVPPPDVFITAGPDGNLWFLENDGHVGRITLAGEVKRFPAFEPTNPAYSVIIAGPDGNLWFSAQPGKIGRITPSGVVTLFPLPPKAEIGTLAAGPDGHIWFIRSDTSYTDMSGTFWWTQIGRITP
jgi:virginiamycin B lyase